MTARVSASSPSGPHMWPEVRIIAGIEASTITSEGTCRLVMPLSESTIASSRPVGQALLDGCLDLAARPPAGRSRPFEDARRGRCWGSGRRPRAARRTLRRLGKNALTTWPKMIGSETFIMVALRWAENSTPSSLARAICAARNASRAAARMTVRVDDLAGSRTGRPSLRTVTVPSSADQLDLEVGVGRRSPRTSRWSGSRRRPWWRRWSWSRRSRRPSSAGACGRSSSPTRARGGRSCPRAGPG